MLKYGGVYCDFASDEVGIPCLFDTPHMRALRQITLKELTRLFLLPI